MRALPNGAMVKPGAQIGGIVGLGRGAAPAVPGTAMRRAMGTASQGSGARPMTAVSGAGFNSRQTSSAGFDSITTITLEPKIETFIIYLI